MFVLIIGKIIQFISLLISNGLKWLNKQIRVDGLSNNYSSNAR